MSLTRCSSSVPTPVSIVLKLSSGKIKAILERRTMPRLAPVANSFSATEARRTLGCTIYESIRGGFSDDGRMRKPLCLSAWLAMNLKDCGTNISRTGAISFYHHFSLRPKSHASSRVLHSDALEDCTSHSPLWSSPMTLSKVTLLSATCHYKVRRLRLWIRLTEKPAASVAFSCLP